MLYKIYRIIISFLPSKLYAHLLGVKIGPNTFIATKNWSWEPYLINIGSNCQITKDVHFHTHGGGMLFACLFRTSMFLEELRFRIGVI